MISKRDESTHLQAGAWKRGKCDYDDNPIIITDYLPYLSLIFFYVYALIPILVLLSFMLLNNKTIDWTHVSISISVLGYPTYFFLKNRADQVREIYFYGDKIVRTWGDDSLEINIHEITNIKKSYIDFIDKKQEAIMLYKPLFWLLSPIVLFIFQPIFIILKRVFKSIKKFDNTDLFDTLVIYNKEGDFIAIFIPDVTTKNDLTDYFSNQNLSLDDLKVLFATSYSPDPITNYINSKDN
jgi:hypothetical protein